MRKNILIISTSPRRDGNSDTLADNFVKTEIPQIKAVPSQAAYLLWLDCTKMLGNTTEAFKKSRKIVEERYAAGEPNGNHAGFQVNYKDIRTPDCFPSCK